MDQRLIMPSDVLPWWEVPPSSSTPNNPTFIPSWPKYSENIRPNAIPTFGLQIKDLIDEANINIETIRQATIPESPPWQLESPLIIYGLKTVKKVDTNPLVFQVLLNDVQDKYFDHQFLYTDGSKEDHKVGCAVVSNFNIIKRRLPGQSSIYTAELCAILLALDVVNNSNKDKYVIYVDFFIVSTGNWTAAHIDHPLVLDVLEKYSALINKTVLFCCQPRWLSGLRRSRVHSLVIARRSLCPEKLGSNPGQGSKGIVLGLAWSRYVHYCDKETLHSNKPSIILLGTQSCGYTRKWTGWCSSKGCTEWKTPNHDITILWC